MSRYRDPWARGGPTTAENLCLLCKAHNHHAARKAFGEAHVDKKILESEYERTLSALRKLGFRGGEARKALTVLKRTSRATRVQELLVEALVILVPPSPNLAVRESRRPYGLSSDQIACPGTEMAIRSSALAYRTDHDRRPHIPHIPLRRRWPQNEQSAGSAVADEPRHLREGTVRRSAHHSRSAIAESPGARVAAPVRAFVRSNRLSRDGDGHTFERAGVPD